MANKTCCVTGHRDIPDVEIPKIKAALEAEIAKAVQDGFTEFLSGFADGVDQYFAELIADKKNTHSELRLVAVLPYRARIVSLEKEETAKALLAVCDDVVVIQEKSDPSVYAKRNRYLVENADRVIAVYDGRETGGTVGTIRFAHMLQKELREIPVGTIIDPKHMTK